MLFAESLRRHLDGSVSLTDEQVGQLEAHYRLLLRWNKVVNLTAVQSEEEIVQRHYCESLFLGAHLPAGSWSIVDIGSGAGFPGLPVAVLRPECSVALIESHQRKAVFLRESTRTLGNVRVIAQRAESVHDHFDWAISRAVRYSEIRDSLRRLASRAALLTGEAEDAGSDAGCFGGFEWQEPIPLPWGRRRFLLVSRETGEAQ